MLTLIYYTAAVYYCVAGSIQLRVAPYRVVMLVAIAQELAVCVCVCIVAVKSVLSASLKLPVYVGAHQPGSVTQDVFVLFCSRMAWCGMVQSFFSRPYILQLTRVLVRVRAR